MLDKKQIWLKVLSLDVYFWGTKDSHYVWIQLLMLLVLGWAKVVGQDSEVSRETGVCWKVDAGVTWVAGWERGVKEWMWFWGAVLLEPGVLLFWVLVDFCLLRRFLGIQCAGKCGHDAGWHVGKCSLQAIDGLKTLGKTSCKSSGLLFWCYYKYSGYA